MADQLTQEKLASMSDEELLRLAEGDPNVLEGDVKVIEDGSSEA